MRQGVRMVFGLRPSGCAGDQLSDASGAGAGRRAVLGVLLHCHTAARASLVDRNRPHLLHALARAPRRSDAGLLRAARSDRSLLEVVDTVWIFLFPSIYLVGRS